jgi:predicted transcriptional regulator
MARYMLDTDTCSYIMKRSNQAVLNRLLKTLHAHGFIEREPGKARSLMLRLTREQLPDLE